MATGNARESAPRTPNRALRAIRENERHESQNEFAEAMAQVAREIGVEVYPDGKYVQRLESGHIAWPHHTYRTILEKLCGRSAQELGLASSARSAGNCADHSGETSSHANVALREAIWESGIELTEFASKIGVHPKTAERWITRGMIPQPFRRWKASLILGIDESELWPETDSATPEGAVSDHQPEVPLPGINIAEDESFGLPDPLRAPLAADMVEDMKRRAFLMGLATAAGFSTVGAMTARESIRHETSLSLIGRIGTTGVEEWREIAFEYGESYPVTEPGELLKSLMVDLYGVQAAIQANASELEQRQLRSSGAMLSAFTAQTIANLGNLREARRWWRTARNAADESEEPFTVLWIRGREIVRAGYEHRPLPMILQLIDELEARITGKFPITAMPEFLSGKAQTLALMGEPASDEAGKTLNRLREAFGALPSSTRMGTNSIFSWGEERLRFTESLTYTYLGNYRNADHAQAAALALYPADDLRSPAQIELQRALCFIGAGDVLSGVRHAQTIISGLPVMHRIRPVADLGHKVLRAIPAQKRDDASVQEYDECLTAAFVTVPELTA